MTEKFNNVPVEDDTEIIFSTPAKFGEYEVLYQKWIFDGIIGESLIFAENDITNITMDELENEIRNSPMVIGNSRKITTANKNSFTFFNFNFVVDDDGL